ncbi:hypothetical protein [Nocardioides pantholopis]|uniref:hypothetical protein n=1 Tax=Nocardioides pantholopis TaxID=2483798 RepID=UPI001F14B48A|nr:hypothetical protein [Nocardioides pantholopis]
MMMHAVVSVDGFIADEHDDVGPLFDWYFNGDLPVTEEAAEERHAPFRVGERSYEYLTSMSPASAPSSRGATCST